METVNATDEIPDPLDLPFTKKVRPLLERYCLSCHGEKKQEGSLNLSKDSTAKAIAKNSRQWAKALDRLKSKEMPPDDAPRQPSAEERTTIIDWLRELHDREAQRTAGDPGVVLARRLSNAELDYTIRDLTGVDIRPTREFPVDPANEAGFDNSGESLAMSPALLKKYLAAARQIADHVVLKPEGFVFAPHPVAAETDRDKYCVKRIIDFYTNHAVDYADYFFAAWRFRHRQELGQADADLDRITIDAKLSPKYLAMIWSVLTDSESELGPLAVVRKVWNELPAPGAAKVDAARAGCERLRDLVLKMRKTLKPSVEAMIVDGISPGSQPFVLWRNRQAAERTRGYTGNWVDDFNRLFNLIKATDKDLARPFVVIRDDLQTATNVRGALERFCSVFPAAFFVPNRASYVDAGRSDKQRPLSAGFHLMHGYFREDEPLCELILDKRQRDELDELWTELAFVTLSPIRQFKDFIFFERAEPPRFMYGPEFDFARSEDKDSISEPKMARLAELHLAKARKQGASPAALAAIETYYADMSKVIRRVEQSRLAAEPSHLQALVKFAERAYRRPLANAERDDLRAYYRALRQKEELSHEEALRDSIVSVLMSPHFYYRFELLPADARKAYVPLTDYELASRLSYFLWSSMPDAKLLEQAAAGDLRKPEVLIAETRRMLQDPKIRGLGTEFAGNWLDFRRFEEHNSVDRDRFPIFTNELRQAMFEEPVRYFMDVVQRNRSILDLLNGNDTFVNRPLAKHYGIPLAPPRKGEDEWVHIDDAQQFGRGGLLPMAIFLTKNAPGLRTSPVKRGYWVVRRLLGEQIPPPPPTVPELPKDEADLGALTLPQLLAKHRDNKACAGCHQRFDSVGLVFEGFGPIGERRTKDLGGKPVDTKAVFPDGAEHSGLEGLRAYLCEKRQDDFVDNLCKKLFSFALARGLALSDTQALEAMKKRLKDDGYRFDGLVEAIVTSSQFLNKRGRE